MALEGTLNPWLFSWHNKQAQPCYCPGSIPWQLWRFIKGHCAQVLGSTWLMACAIGGTVHLQTQHISERGIGRRKTGIWQLPSQIHPRATLVEAATRTNASFIGFVETQSSFKARQIKLCSSGRRHVDKIRFKSQKAPESEGSAINLSENPKQMISISTEKKKKKKAP